MQFLTVILTVGVMRLRNITIETGIIFVILNAYFRCSSDHINILSLSSGVSAVVIFFFSHYFSVAKNTHCVTMVSLWPLAVSANYNLNSPGKEHLNLSQQIALINTLLKQSCLEDPMKSLNIQTQWAKNENRLNLK